MALIKLDPIVDKISGKVGGQSFVAGTNGNYIRNNAQTRKGTINQGYQSKTKTPSVNATWQKLTNAEKQTFIDLVGTYPYINRIDEVQQYSAYQIFMLCAQGTQLINESIKFSGSTFVIINKPLIEAFVNNSASMTVEILNPQSGIFYAIYATNPQGVGIYSVRRQLRYIGFVTETIAANKFDISAIYDNKFNAILPNRNYGIMVKPIVLNSGQIGPKSDISVSPFLDIPTPPNTIIGGLGASVPNAATLETLLGLAPGDISSFALVGTEINCFIEVAYTIPNDTFINNTDITTYFDLDNLCTLIGRRGFYNSTIQEVSFNGCLTISGTNAGQGAFRFCSQLTTISFDSVTLIQEWAFDSANLTGSFNMPNLTEIKRAAFKSNPNFIGFTNSLDNLLTLGNNVFLFCTSLTVFSSISLLTCSGSVFNSCTAITLINIPAITDLGGTPLNNNVFINMALNAVINVNSIQETIDGGLPDGDLVYAITNRMATVNYI